jgi:uncharacterized protein YjiS (DUF1127 family)
MKRLITSLIAASNQRRQYRELLEMDVRLLADMGMTRMEIMRRAASAGNAGRVRTLY